MYKKIIEKVLDECMPGGFNYNSETVSVNPVVLRNKLVDAMESSGIAAKDKEELESIIDDARDIANMADDICLSVKRLLRYKK